MPEIEGQEPNEEIPTPQEGQPDDKGPDAPKQYSADYVKRLRDEAAKHRTRAAELERKEQERADAEKSEVEREKSARARAEKEHEAARLENARLKAAMKHGLSEEDFDFIHGDTAEEIEKRAEAFAKRMKASAEKPQAGSTRPRPMANAGSPGVNDAEAINSANRDRLNAFFGGKLTAKK